MPFKSTRFGLYKDLLSSSNYFKLVCGAGNEDKEEVEYLTFIYTLAGCAGFDVSATPEVVLSAKKGIDAAISKKKDVNFIGKEALEKIKKQKLSKRFAMFVLKENKPGEPLILHDEPIYFEDKIIGRTTSGNYSFNYKKNLAFGYIRNEYSENNLLNGKIYIEIEKNKYSAELILKPLKQTNFKNN